MAPLLNIKSDIYCEEDLLGFDKYIDTLSKMIKDKGFKTPFCIGIFGKWGSGKTSFMHLLEKKLSEDETEPHTIPVWFNPWRYEKEEHLIIPFLKTIEHDIERYIEKQKGLGTKLQGILKKAAQKIGDASAAFAYGISAECKLGGFGISLDTSKAAAREEKLGAKRVEEAKKLSDKLSSTYYDIVEELKSAVDEQSFRIVVFVDDLDRCLPDKAVELLEAIKLFLDIEGYLFFLGLDREVIKKGISYRYRFFEHKEEKEEEGLILSPEDYLDKMIQLPLELPTIERGRKIRFIESLMDNAEGFTEHADLITTGVGDNPRTLKRFINLLAFTVSLAETIKENIINDRVLSVESKENKEILKRYFIPILYIKWTIIVFRFPKIFSAIKGNPKMLIDLQKSVSENWLEEVEDKKLERVEIQVDQSLKKILLKPPLFPDDEWLIERFIHLTESTVISEKDKASTTGFSQSFKPGDMVLIPKGKFLYGYDKIEQEIGYDYKIDVFPVTNKQYKEFIDATNHEVPFEKVEHSSPYNWDKENRTYPEGLGDHPVVNVNYEDAVAYCRWRSEKEGAKVRLPTEEEWEKAARGIDGRDYPWGDEFDYKKLNCADYHAGRIFKDFDKVNEFFNKDFFEKNKEKALTSEVGRFANGASPFGCNDMAGNVWEWTDTWHDKRMMLRLRAVVPGVFKVLTAACPCTSASILTSGPAA